MPARDGTARRQWCRARLAIEKLLRGAALFLHRDATVDISRFKIVKAMFPETAGVHAGAEK
jgi:hypothetical protein